MDLGQVEVIKGVASAAVRRRRDGRRRQPDLAAAGRRSRFAKLLVNRSTRGATDAVLFSSRAAVDPLAAHRCSAAATGRSARTLTRTRGPTCPNTREAWFGRGSSGMAAMGDHSSRTVGATYEDRSGGTMPGRDPAGDRHAYREALDTRRSTRAALGQLLLRQRYVVTARAAVARQRHDHQFGEIRERDQHRTTFGEVAVRGTAPRQTWVVGAALERERYIPRDLPQFAYTFTIPGVFVQDDIDVDALAVGLSERPPRSSQRIRHVLQPARVGTVALGRWTAAFRLEPGSSARRR